MLKPLFCSLGVLCFFSVGHAPSSASEIHISGNRVIITSDDGSTIDTANLPEGEEVKDGDGVEINENGVSIGSVTSQGGEQKNVRRSTQLDNVTIINNGKATIYRKGTAGGGKEGK